MRKFARELGVDLAKVTGSGRKGRILREDITGSFKTTAAPAAAPAAAPSGGMGIPPIPKVDFSKFGPIEDVEMPRIKKISGPALHRSWLNIPHVTNNDEADITDLDKYRKELDTRAKEEGYRVTMLSFLIKACVSALKTHWEVNSSIHPDGDKLIRKGFWNIGFAADTPNGLMVPVVKAADAKGIVEISKELGDLSAKARKGELKSQDMQGATFTISSLGGIGGTSFTPIVNAPGGGDPRGDALEDGAGLERHGVRAAQHAAAVALLRPPGDRRGTGGALPAEARRPAQRSAQPAALRGDAWPIEVKVPDIGDFKDVPVITVFVKPGDTVRKDDPLVELESDKATMEVPSPAAGKVASVSVKEGDKVAEGSVILTLEAEGAAAAPASPAAAPAPKAAVAGGDVHGEVVVLGSGPGGYTAAFRAADLGKKVVLIEKDPTLGGVCLNVGCIPSKALLHAAKVISEAEEMGHFGVKFAKPKVDVDGLRGWKESVVKKLTGGLSGLAKGAQGHGGRGRRHLHRPERDRGRRARTERRPSPSTSASSPPAPSR